MTSDEIREDIIGACREFRRRGGRVIERSFGDGKTCGCALQAVSIVKRGHGLPPDGTIRQAIGVMVRELWGWDVFQADHFVYGFDDSEVGKSEQTPFYDLGRSVRDAVLPSGR